MTPEEQRIAIAEVCAPGIFLWHDTINGAFHRSSSSGDTEDVAVLPDFLNDLNAMHEAEKVLPGFHKLPLEKNRHRYWDNLVEVCDGSVEAAFATAAQRAEAFLRTVGKWKRIKRK